MRTVNLSTILWFSFFCLVSPMAAWASERIEVVKSEGMVETAAPDQITRTPVHEKSEIPANNIVTTGPDGRAVIKVGKSGYIVLEKNSTVEINKSSSQANIFRQVTGMIFYALNAIRGSRKPVEVVTSTATIGIRGTRFLVADTTDRKEIGMRKGQISVTSPDEAYEIHRQAEADEFAAFKKEAQDAIKKEQREFAEYKAETKREFIEYKREFSLKAGRMVSFDGRRVAESALSKETETDMQSLEDYAGEWLEKVQD